MREFIMLVTFDTLYAFSLENQSATAKRKPLKLLRKFGEKTTSLTIAVDPDTLTSPVDVVAAAGQQESVAGFASPIGEASLSKPFTLTPAGSMTFASNLIGYGNVGDSGELVPAIIADRGANVEPNVPSANGTH